MARGLDGSHDLGRQAIWRGACHGVGGRDRLTQGSPGVPLHTGFARGLPQFLQWAPKTLTLASSPSRSQRGPRKPGAAPHST